MTAMQRMLNSYLSEVVLYGGLPVRRGLMIQDLESRGIPTESRNYWLAGSDARVVDTQPCAESLEEFRALIGE